MNPFTLPQLPYAYDALVPFIDKETMTIHHQKHHQAYVDNLNTALAQANETNPDLDSLLQRISEYSPAVRNNGGGHYNHSLFWEILSPKPQLTPKGILHDAITATFGNLEHLKSEMKKTGLAQFGSGWVWLFVKFNGSLAISSTPNQDNPMMDILSMNRGFPIIGIDVWEHAYYLNYQNKRADYLDAFWSVLDWSAVEKKYEEALSKVR